MTPLLRAIDALRRVGNLAGSPTMDYAPEIVIQEQRQTLDLIAILVADALKELVGPPPARACLQYMEGLTATFQVLRGDGIIARDMNQADAELLARAINAAEGTSLPAYGVTQDPGRL
jgi:hypothetical protein